MSLDFNFNKIHKIESSKNKNWSKSSKKVKEKKNYNNTCIHMYVLAVKTHPVTELVLISLHSAC